MTMFTNKTAILAVIKRDRLAAALANYLEEAPSDDYIWAKLMAAEAETQHALRVWFTPREVIPESADAAEAAALAAGGAVVELEPGYDYDPALFHGNTWGRLDLRHTPIIAVHGITFTYPGVANSAFTVPRDWIRLDRKYGVVNLVPASSAVALPLDAFRLSILGGGRSVPLMVQVRYSAGLSNACADYPDLVDLVMKAAVLGMIDDQFVPQSGSVSADGLSQSISMDAQKYRDMLDRKTDRLRDALHGIRMVVL